MSKSEERKRIMEKVNSILDAARQSAAEPPPPPPGDDYGMVGQVMRPVRPGPIKDSLALTLTLGSRASVAFKVHDISLLDKLVEYAWLFRKISDAVPQWLADHREETSRPVPPQAVPGVVSLMIYKIDEKTGKFVLHTLREAVDVAYIDEVGLADICRQEGGPGKYQVSLLTQEGQESWIHDIVVDEPPKPKKKPGPKPKKKPAKKKAS